MIISKFLLSCAVRPTKAMPVARRHSQAGFSLIEMAVVLAIIALLAGSVLALQNYLRATELKSIMIDVERFKSMFLQFQDRYKALPGDLPDATNYWGAAHADFNTCKTTVSNSKATCNGDGNGTISTWGTATTYYERYRAWQQLSNAGFIEGNYTGVQGAGGASEARIAVNTPASEVNGGGFSLRYHPLGFADANWFASTYHHLVVFGGFVTADTTNAPMVTPLEANDIDQKIDDGRPGAGLVMGFTSNFQPNCVSTNVVATAAYVLANTDQECALIFKLGF